MFRRARFASLILLFTFSLSAKFLINDNLISPKATDLIEKIGKEAKEKTGISLYAIATNDKIARRESLYDYVKKYKSRMSEPYIAIIFAPNSKRIGIIVSNKSLEKDYNPDRVKNYAIAIVSSADSNSLQSKYDVGLVQAYSELADEVASAKGVKLKNTIKEKGGWVLKIITWLVYLGSVLVLWVYFGQPLYRRIRYGKQ